MNGPWLPSQVAVETEGEFLRRVLKGIDSWFADDANLDHARELLHGRLIALDNVPDHRDDGADADPVVEVIGTELHRLRRLRAIVTVVTCGGYRHQRVRIGAVHRHHTVLNSHDDRPGVLLPLAFIESVQHVA